MHLWGGVTHYGCLRVKKKTTKQNSVPERAVA